MCLAILSKTFIKIELIEQIWLGSDSQGNVTAEEVYDVFFSTPPKDRFDPKMHANLVLLGLSQHKSFDAKNQPTVRAESLPGIGGKYDSIYTLKRSYESKHFCVQIPSQKGRDSEAGAVELEGKVESPQLVIPAGIVKNDAALALMGEKGIGTLFEIRFQNLEPGRAYFMRLVISPHQLNLQGPEAEVILDDSRLETSRWQRFLTIISPEILLDNCKLFLDYYARPNTPPNDGVIQFREVLNLSEDGQRWRLAHLATHRLFVILDRESSFEEVNNKGAIFFVGPGNLEVNGPETVVRALQWEAGAQAFWHDDSFEYARSVLIWMREFGTDPKSKQEISASIAAPNHGNTALIVDALVAHGLLKVIGANQYCCDGTMVPPAAVILAGNLDSALEQTVSSDEVLRSFKPAGFQTMGTFKYRYTSPSFLKRQRRAEWERIFVFWGTILGILLGFTAILVSFAAWANPHWLPSILGLEAVLAWPIYDARVQRRAVPASQEAT